uniref:Transporter n=1 Tax=Poecilia reticulata TaxID=8081 RepID=A0A3P9QEE8_POERE
MELAEENSKPLSDVKPSPVDTGAQRPTWCGQLDFILATVGYAVGLGNVWRFPYLCYSRGGGAFIIPYIVMVFICGIPLLFMEFAVGQYTRLGPVHAFTKICPLSASLAMPPICSLQASSSLSEKPAVFPCFSCI